LRTIQSNNFPYNDFAKESREKAASSAVNGLVIDSVRVVIVLFDNAFLIYLFIYLNFVI